MKNIYLKNIEIKLCVDKKKLGRVVWGMVFDKFLKLSFKLRFFFRFVYYKVIKIICLGGYEDIGKW